MANQSNDAKLKEELEKCKKDNLYLADLNVQMEKKTEETVEAYNLLLEEKRKLDDSVANLELQNEELVKEMENLRQLYSAKVQVGASELAMLAIHAMPCTIGPNGLPIINEDALDAHIKMMIPGSVKMVRALVDYIVTTGKLPDAKMPVAEEREATE